MNLPATIDRMRSQMPGLRARVSPLARWIVGAIAAGLCVATFGPALAGAAGLPSSALERWVFHACGPFCHQAPSRTFFIEGHALPLCTRCTGMWIGITTGLALAMTAAFKRRWSVGVVAAVVALVLSEADHLREISGQPGWPWVRFGLGLLMFVGVTLAVSFDGLAVVLAAARGLHNSFRRRQG